MVNEPKASRNSCLGRRVNVGCSTPSIRSKHYPNRQNF
jgi:hypothetical protein